jgi:hypothetical protein
MLAIVVALPVAAAQSPSAQAAAAQSPDPRTKPQTLVAEGIRLLEAKDYVKFLQTFVPPDEFKRLSEQASAEQIVASAGFSERIGMLLTALKSIKDATPALDAEGATATYQLKEPILGNRDTMVFIKVGDFWYLRN